MLVVEVGDGENAALVMGIKSQERDRSDRPFTGDGFCPSLYKYYPYGLCLFEHTAILIILEICTTLHLMTATIG